MEKKEKDFPLEDIMPSLLISNIDKDMKRKFRIVCIGEDTTMSAKIRKLMADYVKAAS